MIFHAFKTPENVFQLIFNVANKHRKTNQFSRKYFLENKSFSKKRFPSKSTEHSWHSKSLRDWLSLGKWGYSFNFLPLNNFFFCTHTSDWLWLSLAQQSTLALSVQSSTVICWIVVAPPNPKNHAALCGCQNFQHRMGRVSIYGRAGHRPNLCVWGMLSPKLDSKCGRSLRG